jgi:hypothetical protein
VYKELLGCTNVCKKFASLKYAEMMNDEFTHLKETQGAALGEIWGITDNSGRQRTSELK